MFSNTATTASSLCDSLSWNIDHEVLDNDELYWPITLKSAQPKRWNWPPHCFWLHTHCNDLWAQHLLYKLHRDPIIRHSYACSDTDWLYYNKTTIKLSYSYIKNVKHTSYCWPHFMEQRGFKPEQSFWRNCLLALNQQEYLIWHCIIRDFLYIFIWFP